MGNFMIIKDWRTALGMDPCLDSNYPPGKYDTRVYEA